MPFNIRKDRCTYLKRVRPSWKNFIQRPKTRGVGVTRRNKEESKVRRQMAARSRRINQR